MRIENGETDFDFLLSEDGDYNENSYNFQLLLDAGFIDGGASGVCTFYVNKITWAGHDFLDSVRDEKTWSKTKAGALAAGGWTFDMLKDLAKGYIKKQAEELTGIKL